MSKQACTTCIIGLVYFIIYILTYQFFKNLQSPVSLIGLTADCLLKSEIPKRMMVLTHVQRKFYNQVCVQVFYKNV